MNIRDIRNQRFGRLLVLRRGGNVRKEIGWICLCDCGNKTLVGGYTLRNGTTRSCGCLRNEKTAARDRERATHGMSGTPTWVTWNQMWQRCTNQNMPNYRYYGARGITISWRWNSFQNFLADMGERPEGHTLDRKDPNGNYEPGNCRWVTPKQQANGRRNCRIVTYNGLSLNVRQWSERTGLSHNIILKRLSRGWSPQKTLTATPRKYA